MVNSSPEGTSDDEQWKQACQCAEFKICLDITRNYSLRWMYEDIYADLEKDIPDDILDRALKHSRQTFDVGVCHYKYLKFLKKIMKDVEYLATRTARLPSSHSLAWKRDGSKHVLGHHRYQLPVGQGGFHVGTLRDLGKDESTWRSSIVNDAIVSADFMYVYDCGSIPIEGVENAVRSIVAKRVSRRLDMLFVSHFDRDHVCGIPYLLHEKKGLQVDTIVIPYLDDIDRIIAFGSSSATRAEPRAERFYNDIVVDPIGVFEQFEPRQIIMVASDEEDEGGSGFFELPTITPPHSDPDGQSWTIKDTIGTRSTRGLPPVPRRTPEGAIVMQSIEFEVATGTKGGWLLKPYVKKASKLDRDTFCLAVEVLLKWPRGSFREKVRNEKVRRSLVTKHLTILSRAYAWAFGDKNETSLSLYSGPANPEEAGAVVYRSKMLDSARIGWMGTGDACFKDPKMVRNFQNHFSGELEWVSTFMLPHHGSAHNFDPTLPVVDADLWVAAAQPIHPNWKHPAPEIVKAIKASGARFRKVGSSPDSRLEERMVVFWPG